MRHAILLSLTACATDLPASVDSDTPASACAPGEVVVTDIDETLTTSDAEWLKQLVNDPTHDPAMRPDANTLLHEYADRGYAIAYVTARGENLTLTDGTTAREATEEWLLAHGFPHDPALLFLAESTVFGAAAASYKTDVVRQLSEDGLSTVWAYGNAESDIEGFRNAGVPDARIFLVGVLAGTLGVNPIPDEDAFTAHVQAHMNDVERAACAGSRSRERLRGP